ncbi:hypothetical protein [Arthrobacter oryzae]|uniref:hypothetical protein n=1 Tax=Arthrobacter oryzae TaxID=409290 RepID=UPI0027814BAA|nr:hypothetical protein [Arthrobacter oryzae]MDQ0078276.1 hypothetical protein [Arthrobacter oryzae]
MQGALYYPFIRVPTNAWWTRTLLYWDSVATITPMEFIHEPELHDPNTLELIRAGLVYQVEPFEAEYTFSHNFPRFLGNLHPDELARRRSRFSSGSAVRVHMDKFFHEYGLWMLTDLGLAAQVDGQWAEVELATADEFMAALAFSLCQAAGENGWNRGGHQAKENWVPVTDARSSAQALLSGLAPTDGTANPSEVELRVNGDLQLAHIRSVALEGLLPVPAEPLDVDAILQFRRRHKDLLPQFRRDMEKRLGDMSNLDPVALRREQDLLEGEAQQLSGQVEAYLHEVGVQRLIRGPIVALLSLIPVIGPLVAGGIKAGTEPRHAGLIREPLAYLAFAKAEFAPVLDYRVDPQTGPPLLGALSGN